MHTPQTATVATKALLFRRPAEVPHRILEVFRSVQRWQQSIIIHPGAAFVPHSLKKILKKRSKHF
jgi:hypothetical protein